MLQEGAIVDFFKTLQSKLERTPSRNFDQRMKNALDLEMGVSTSPTVRNPFRILIPAFSMALLITLYFSTSNRNAPEPDFAESVEFLQNLDTLTRADDELLSASEEDWALLLDGVES